MAGEHFFSDEHKSEALQLSYLTRHRAAITSEARSKRADRAGGDFVMLGCMLAGHKECAGRIVKTCGEQFKRFTGDSRK